MAPLVIFFGLVLFVIPVVLIALVVAHFRIRREIAQLRAELVRLAGSGPATEPAPVPAPLPAPESKDPAHPPMAHISRQAHPDRVKRAAEPAGPDRTKSATPWTEAPPPDTTPTEPKAPSALLIWLTQNWFYAAAAASLALAGIFFVQYGIETGLLGPRLRVAAALAFGVTLIAAGEFIRRRWGDDAASASAYLPSVLSGAGLVSLMGGIVAARLLYDLIGPGPALVALALVAGGGLLLGWLHGPLLAAVGLIGGMGAPFAVGGSSETPEWLLLYFGTLTALGLGIDTLRRWGWISALALGLGQAAGWLLHLGTGSETMAVSLAAYSCALVALAVLIPARSLIPDQAGRTLGQTIAAQDPAGAGFATWLAGAAVLAASATLVVLGPMTALTWWVALWLASGLTAALILASRPAPALQDLPALPSLAMLALIAGPTLSEAPRDALAAALTASEGLTEQRLPWDILLILLAAVIPTLAAFWRSRQPGDFGVIWAGAASLLAPLAGLALELTWHPALTIGQTTWALHALGLSALMVAFAERYARADGADHLRASLAVLSALACLAFALGVVLTTTALTLALAATVLAASALDRRFDLPLMEVYVAAGVVGLGYRLVIDPGLVWAENAPLWEVLLSYPGTVAALLAALAVLPSARTRARVFLESGAWSAAGVTLSLLLFRGIESATGWDGVKSHWHFGLNATIWLVLMMAQLYRLRLGGALRSLRIGLAGLFGLFALGALTLAVVFANPLLPYDGQRVPGWPVLNTLAPAYLLPGLLLVAGAVRLRGLWRPLRWSFAGVGLALAALWAGLAIRHAWRGAETMGLENGVTQPELYSYTVALLLCGAGLFYQALARRSDRLRRAGVALIGLAVAKVFLIDISGLTGLVRVFSFLLLGLSLAGLAWLNRWIGLRAAKGDGT